MDFEDFTATLEGDAPPTAMAASLRALWHARRGDWDTAHRLVQDDGGTDAAWVHAHLHRVEGDLANAGYWYRRAGRAAASGALAAEWEEIARALAGG